LVSDAKNGNALSAHGGIALNASAAETVPAPIATPEAAIEQDTGIAPPRLEAVPFFAGMDPAALASIADEISWFDLPGGKILFAEKEPADAFYVVLSGLLGIERNGSREVEVHPDDIVGEVAMLDTGFHSATVTALRDTSLLRVPAAAFERLLTLHPEAMMRVTAQIIGWLRRPRFRDDRQATPRTIALLPVGDEPAAPLARALADQFGGTGLRVALLDSGAAATTEAEFAAIEQGHDRVIYCADAALTNWSRLCARRADHAIMIVDGAAAPQRPPILAALQTSPWQRFELAVMQDRRPLPLPAGPWLAQVPARFHYHLRRGDAADMARLARMLSGRAVGLVLSGGGARAYAHVGVVQALQEAGVAFDLVGGTSMGAIVGAGLAHEWDITELRERMFDAFVRSDPLRDVTLPILALTTGRRVTARLKKHFDDDRIEDLWRPYFAVSSNLTSGRLQLHDRGPLWRALRASVAIPGLLPPVIEEGGEVLVDGAVMNNLPTATMTEWNQGPVIGVDVGRRENFRAVKRGPLARLFLGEDEAAPGIVTMLLRAATIGSEVETENSRAHVDLLIEPPLENIGIRDWHAFDRAVESGYRYTREKLSTADLSQFRA
jgi:NTE family protein